MTETWCALLNVVILSIVAGANGVLIRRVGEVRSELENGHSERRAE